MKARVSRSRSLSLPFLSVYLAEPHCYDLSSDLLSDEEFSDSDDEDSDQETEGEAVENDPAEARQIALDNLVPALPPQEYGQMPASFYTNSQKTAPNASDEKAEPNVTELPTLISVKDVANAEGFAPSTFDSTSTTLDSISVPIAKLRRPIFMHDQYDGVIDSDDESDEDEEQALGMIDPNDDEDSDEDRPQVVGDMEIDMAEEQDDFIKFSQEALGISNDQLAGILKERVARGGKHTFFVHKRA